MLLLDLSRPLSLLQIRPAHLPCKPKVNQSSSRSNLGSYPLHIDSTYCHYMAHCSQNYLWYYLLWCYLQILSLTLISYCRIRCMLGYIFRCCHVWNNIHDWNYASSYDTDNTEIVLRVDLRTKREPGQDIFEYNLWWEVDSIRKIDQHKDDHDSSYSVLDRSMHVSIHCCGEPT